MRLKLHLINPTKSGESYLFNRGLLAPLGLMYLAAYTPDDFELRIVDETVERIDFSMKPDIVGISTMTATAPRAYEIADKYRQMGVTVILGGVHASVVPEEAMEHADSVVIGEAEDIWPRVLEDASSGRLEPVYRREGFVELRDLLPPRRDLINPSRYWSANVVQTARGCPHDCNFCSVTTFNGKRPRFRDIDSVLVEVESLPRNNMIRRKVVAFVDDNIAASNSRAKEMFKKLAPMNVIWGSQASISFAYDEELVALAADSGCHFLFIGLETTSPAALKEMGKSQNKVERYEEALGLLKKYNIHVMGAFMFGFDADDDSAFEATYRFAMRNKIQVAQFARLTPYPGTRLYDQLMAEGRVEPVFWRDHNWDKRVVYSPKKMTAEKLAHLTDKIHRDFYSYSSITRRMYPHRRWSYWFAFNLLYRQTVVARRTQPLDGVPPMAL
jgi:radical SAM superfamily enzyme YgiQ (UPF0313 family)